MFEMGQESPAEHAAVIQKALDTPVDERIFIGKDFLSQRSKVKSQNLNVAFYPTAEDAIFGLRTNPIKNSTILIKGSRGMALERLVELF
jgi:UDP-N-acetylmuramoyl-tripeptide--D-alanyl-D-alanine ligase